jgi:uncharacterized protein
MRKTSPSAAKISGHWNIPYEYAAGATASRFFDELKNNQRIMATRCSSCKRTLLPPRAFCERCFVEISDWVEVGPEGVVNSFTVTYQSFPGLPDPPYTIALIKLDHASTCLAHFLGEIDATQPIKLLARVKAGLRVRARFKEERRGSILDIQCFVPVLRAS